MVKGGQVPQALLDELLGHLLAGGFLRLRVEPPAESANLVPYVRAHVDAPWAKTESLDWQCWLQATPKESETRFATVRSLQQVGKAAH